MHYDMKMPVLKSNVQQSFTSYGDPPVGSAYQLTSVSSLYDASVYISGRRAQWKLTFDGLSIFSIGNLSSVNHAPAVGNLSIVNHAHVIMIL
jgi:hypothetical protein